MGRENHIDNRAYNDFEKCDTDFGIKEQIFTDDTLGVRFAYRDDSSFSTKHWHDSIEIIYILEGSTDVILEQEKYSVKTEELMVISSGVVHASSSRGNKALFMQIPIEIPEKYIPDIKEVYFDVPLSSQDSQVNRHLDRLKKLMRQMYMTASGRETGYALRFAALLFDFLYELYHHFARTRSDEGAPTVVADENDRLTRIVEYTQKHYMETLTIADIAAYVHLQPQYFCRYFKKYMGQTYVEYLNELRLSHVCADLVYSTLPLYKILQLHGFKNYKLFRKMFYKKYECTPAELREHMRISGRSLKSEEN